MENCKICKGVHYCAPLSFQLDNRKRGIIFGMETNSMQNLYFMIYEVIAFMNLVKAFTLVMFYFKIGS